MSDTTLSSEPAWCKLGNQERVVSRAVRKREIVTDPEVLAYVSFQHLAARRQIYLGDGCFWERQYGEKTLPVRGSCFVGAQVSNVRPTRCRDARRVGVRSLPLQPLNLSHTGLSPFRLIRWLVLSNDPLTAAAYVLVEMELERPGTCSPGTNSSQKKIKKTPGAR